MKPFKQQWQDLPATKRREAKLALALLVVGGAWALGAATRPPAPPAPKPGFFVCMTGMGQPTAMFPGVTKADSKESDGLIHWMLTIPDYGQMVFIQSPGEACKITPVVLNAPAQKEADAVLHNQPRFNL